MTRHGRSDDYVGGQRRDGADEWEQSEGKKQKQNAETRTTSNSETKVTAGKGTDLGSASRRITADNLRISQQAPHGNCGLKGS